MRKVLILTLVMFFSAIWLEAQTGTASRTSGAGALQGCLAFNNGNYILTNKSGHAYQLSSKTPNLLTRYVGQEIKVSGRPVPSSSMNSMNSMNSNTRSRDTSMQTATTSTRDQQVFEVRTVTHVSDTCESKSK